MNETESEPPGDKPAGAPNAAGTDSQRLLANRYRLDSLLGRGSMGAVWKAHDVILGRSVAVKEVLLPPTQTEEENDVARERALREARSIAALSHPNVVTLYDVVEDDGRPWVVMELVPAKNLAEIIRDSGTLAPAEAARIGLAVLAALESAHEVGITHRDVKPGNILVHPDGRVKLADFGISRRIDDSALTRTGLMVGSPSYIAPEVARGRAATGAADIWGLGATLQCAVEGEPPFDLGDPVATLTAVVGDEPRPAVHAGPLQPVIAKMLAKDPRDRMRIRDARHALEQIIAMRSAPPPTYAPPSGPVSGLHPAMRPSAGPAIGAPPPRAAAAQPRAASPTPPAPPAPPQLGQPPTFGQPTGYRPVQPPPTSFAGSAPRPATSAGSAARPATGPAPRPAAAYRLDAATYAPISASQPAARSKRKPWIAAFVGLLIAGLIAAGVLIWVNRDGSTSGGSPSTTTSGAAVPTPTVHPTKNDTKLDGTTASGAIKVSGAFRPFTFELPKGWAVSAVADTVRDGRSEFIESKGGTSAESMVKVTIAAEPLTADSADAQIKGQMGQLGSPAMLPGYAEVKYKVSNGSVLWQYTNSLQGEKRHGFLYATVRNDILWKVFTSGPADAAESTAGVANNIIKTFKA